MALHPGEQVQLVGEFKRLFGTGKAKSMQVDFARLREYRLNTGGAHLHRGLAQWKPRQVGLLAATTWRSNFAEWFTTFHEGTVDPTDGVLDGLHEQVKGHDPYFGARVLSDYVDTEGQRRSQWLVYVLFNLD